MLDAVLQKVRNARHLIAPALLVTGLQVPMAQANETGLLIWPVSPNIQSHERAEALWLENTGRSPMSIQVRVFSWQQNNYQNLFDNQRLIIPSPPMARIEPGQKQLVRLIKASPAAPGTEQAFRVQLDEVPIPDVQRTVINGLGVLMRYSIPLYVYGDGLAYDARKKSRTDKDIPNSGAPRLGWKIVTEGGQRYVEISNSGNVHAQLSRGFFNMANGKQVELSRSGVGTVLAGASMRWPLPAGVSPSATLTMKVNRSKDNVVIDKAF